jgi:D-alanyl-D-alanine carboxypeptidase/D-alanyl-D-alanine-endopeptidase (penicillin-binding protein 4)
MSRHTPLALLLIGLCFAPAAVAQDAAPASTLLTPAQLTERINATLARDSLDKARVSIHVIDLDTGKTLYERDAKTPLNPASNMKLLTAGAALDLFGPSHTFSTRLLGPALSGDTIKGDLAIRGDGEAFLLYKHLLEWAAELKVKGVRRVEGDILVDESAFPGPTLPPGFEQKAEDASYRAPIGAVSVNFNAVTIIASPGDKPGDPVRVRLDPPNNHVKLSIDATTIAGKADKLVVSSVPNEGGTTISVRGQLGQQAGRSISKKRIDEPALFAGAVFVAALDAVGIKVSGQVKRGKPAADAKTLLLHISEPLSYVVLAMNKWSNNFMAEQLMRAIGAKVGKGESNSFAAGLEATSAFLVRLGVAKEEHTLHNGSGLYQGNKISARALTTFLQAMLKHPSAPEFMASLAIAGQDGTLISRLKKLPPGTTLRAKTGTLNEVLSLAGYLHAANGRRVAFAIIFNDTPERSWRYRSTQDDIILAIVSSLQ